MLKTFLNIKPLEKTALLIISGVFVSGAVMVGVSLGRLHPIETAAFLLAYSTIAGSMVHFAWQQAIKPV